MADMGNVKIDPNDLEDLAGQIRDQQKGLEEAVNIVQTEMNKLQDDGIESNAGRELRAKFAKWYNDYMNKYPAAFQAYIQYCNDTASNYRATDAALLQEIGNLSESST